MIRKESGSRREGGRGRGERKTETGGKRRKKGERKVGVWETRAQYTIPPLGP